MTTVREFSMAGPCITLGELTGQTAKMVSFVDNYGKAGKRGGSRLRSGLIHTEPCPSCRDHVHSQYPNGYED